MWRNYYEFAANAHDFPPPLPGGYDAYTIIEGFSSHDSDSVVFDKALEEAFESGLVVDGVVAKSGRERESFWNLRDSFMHIIAKYTDIVDLDTSVPILKTRDYIELTEKQLKERFPELVLLLHGHLGDGNLHQSTSCARLHRIDFAGLRCRRRSPPHNSRGERFEAGGVNLVLLLHGHLGDGNLDTH